MGGVAEMAAAKAKTINLLLEDGTLKGVISLADTNWNSGEMFSAPRESVESLVNSEACSKYGVYLLLSENMVYVGQSSDLAKRIKQHIVGKDWWERVIVLTTSDDSLNRSDIDYLEYVLINKAQSSNCLDCDNKCKGISPKVTKFRKVFLEQYLEEALFLLELIGVTVFEESSVTNKSNNTLISSVKKADNDLIEIRAKGEAKEFLIENGIDPGTNWTYASRQRKTNVFWANPWKTALDTDWVLVLNNTYEMQISVFKIPAKSLSINNLRDGKGLSTRNDTPDKIDLKIDADSFIDVISKVDFGDYLIKQFKY